MKLHEKEYINRKLKSRIVRNEYEQEYSNSRRQVLELDRLNRDIRTTLEHVDAYYWDIDYSELVAAIKRLD